MVPLGAKSGPKVDQSGGQREVWKHIFPDIPFWDGGFPEKRAGVPVCVQRVAVPGEWPAVGFWNLHEVRVSAWPWNQSFGYDQ